MYKKGKRVKLESVLIYNINDILKITREKEQKKKIFIINKKRGHITIQESERTLLILPLCNY